MKNSIDVGEKFFIAFLSQSFTILNLFRMFAFINADYEWTFVRARFDVDGNSSKTEKSINHSE